MQGEGNGAALGGNEQPVPADSRTALNSLCRSIAARATGTDLVPQ